MTNIGYYFLWGITWCMQLLPLRVHYLVADVIYLLLFNVVKYRRKVVFENLNNSFPEKTEEEIKTIARKFYRHLSDMFIETFYLVHIPAKEIRKRLNIKNLGLITELCEKHTSCVIVIGHYGNWEWIGPLTCNFPYNYYHFYKPLHSKAWDKLLLEARSRWGCLLTNKDKAYRLLMEAHRKGEINASGFVSDQSPKSNEVQYWTTFLNQDTAIFLGAEKIAKKTNSPVAFLHLKKPKRGYYEIEFTTLIENPADAKPFEITETHVRFLEKIIQQRPELWLWSHRRWKYKKPATEKQIHA